MPRISETSENIKEIKQDLRELKAYILTHMEKENKELADLRVDVAGLKIKSSLWGSVSGALAAVGTLLASSLFNTK